MKDKTVPIIEIDGEYHLKPASRYHFYETRFIPQALFDLYLERRHDLEITKSHIKLRFKPLKDKPMVVTRNHVQPGEVHRFNDDGSITVISA